MIDAIKKDFAEALEVLKKFISDESNLHSIEIAATLIAKSLKNGNKIISCGNGGSLCDAIHFAEELSGRFRLSRRPLSAIAISDSAHITCVANDFGFEYIFSRFVESVGNPGDILLAISTSGNSENIKNAILAAREIGMQVVTLTGKTGGEIASMCDVDIRAPYTQFSDRAQEIHIKVIHTLVHAIELELFPELSE